jgi:hypothetical protein
MRGRLRDAGSSRSSQPGRWGVGGPLCSGGFFPIRLSGSPRHDPGPSPQLPSSRSLRERYSVFVVTSTCAVLR